MNKKDIFLGLMIAVSLAFFVSAFVSPWPDGLERVAKDKGFLEKGKITLTSPIPDYLWPGIKNERLATSLAGTAGALIVFILGYGVAILLKKRKN